MNTALPIPLLGGMSPRDFMRRHWQKEPLLVRAALPEAPRLLERAEIIALAEIDGVESRLVVRDGDRWSLRQGPFKRRALPALKTPGWTLLVQGADLHFESAHRLLGRFRFVPDARIDDVMLSFATDGGGVGPHIDTYDVFLLQVRGRRRWKVGRLKAPVLRDDVPLKMLSHFAVKHEWLLEPGDMLYLPPGWAHEGVAEGETITASIGFRSAGDQSLGFEVLQQILDAIRPKEDETHYADPDQEATSRPACIPVALRRFADEAVAHIAGARSMRACALGQVLSEPKPGVWFDPGEPPDLRRGVRLDRRTRMLYDDTHAFINGEAHPVAGHDARLVRRLADRRSLEPGEVAALGDEARGLIAAWVEAGWLRLDAELPMQGQD